MEKRVTKNGYEAAIVERILQRSREENIKGEEEIKTINEVYRDFRNKVGDINKTEEIRNIDIDIGDMDFEKKQEPIKDDIKITEEHKEEKQKEEIEDNER